MHGIKDNYEVREVGAPVSAANNTDSNSDRIDMADYESVMFIVPITDSVATGVATAKVEENDSDQDSGMAAVTDCQAQDTCAINDDLNDQVLVVEYRNPAKRYVQLVRTSATANIAFGTAIAILKPRRLPVTEHSTVLDSAYVSN